MAQNINEVIRLCRRTGFTAGEKRPKGYPEKFFSRCVDVLKVSGNVLLKRNMGTDVRTRDVPVSEAALEENTTRSLRHMLIMFRLY